MPECSIELVGASLDGPEPLGSRSFSVVPHVDEYVEILEHDYPAAYQVAGVLHAADGAVRLFVARVGLLETVIGNLADRVRREA